MTLPSLVSQVGGEDGPTFVKRRLIITCADQPGIVAAVSQHLLAAGANIVQSDQYSSDPFGGTFYLRMEVAGVPAVMGRLTDDFESVAERFGMTWRASDPGRKKRLAILLSKQDHCLQDLLYRWRHEELEAEIVMVASNHPDHRPTVEAMGISFHHVPAQGGTDKSAAEERLLELLTGRCDVVVLARYMQILSGEFLRRVGVPVINIHHSFLPAFAGASPYARARERGVKLIGATAHYVTEDLDEGPIIEQDVNRVSHRHGVAALTRLGADVERTVLARAVAWHCEDRVLRDGNTTVVF